MTTKVRFDRFFQSAGLTGEQQDKFLKLAMDDAKGRLAVVALQRAAGGLDPNAHPMNPAAIEQMNAMQKQNDAKTANSLRELLGDHYQAAMQYEKTVSEWNGADQLASQLYYTDAPLTEQQAEQLTQVLAQNRCRPQPGVSPANAMGGAVVPREVYNGAMAQAMVQDMPWMWSSPVTDAAISRAEGVLAPPQIAELKLLQA